VRMKEEDWSGPGVNLKGAFNCLLKAAAKSIISEAFRTIINISSIVVGSWQPRPGNYVASKARAGGTHQSAARELASRHITVNAVAPGFIETAMTQNLPEKVREAMLAQIP